MTTTTTSRLRRIVGGGLLATTIATGLALGSAAVAAATPTQTEAFQDCLKRATPDTEIVCCIASEGHVSTWPDGSYMGCVTRNVPISTPEDRTPTPPKPKPLGPVVRPPVAMLG